MKNNNWLMHAQRRAADFIYHSFFIHILDQIHQVVLSSTKRAFTTSLNEITALLGIFNQ